MTTIKDCDETLEFLRGVLATGVKDESALWRRIDAVLDKRLELMSERNER